MTYSHNRIAAGRNNAERYAHGTSPPNQFFGNGGLGGGAGMHSNRKSNQNRGAWQRTSVNNSTISTSRCVGNGNPILSPTVVPVSSTSTVITTRSGGGGRHSATKSNNPNNFNHHQRTNGVQALAGAGPVVATAATVGLFGRVSPISSLSTITHFAGSKCFDAPAPNALPKPPQHWTSSGSSCSSSSSTSLSSGPIPLTRRSQVAPQTSHHNHYHAAFKSARRALIDDFGTHNLKLLLNVQS